MKMKQTAAVILLCIIQSCAKESLNIPSEIIFKGSLNESVKSTSYLGSGVQVALYIFDKLENCSTSLTPGVILSSDGLYGLYPLEYVILQGSIYDFYSISLNDLYCPYLYFDDNFLAIPENGLDYIWASKEVQYIYKSHCIEFIYRHISSKVNIVVEIPPSFSNASINYIKFTLPNCSGSTIDLKTGEISPASSVNPLSVLDGSGNSRTFIAIPCSSQKEIEVSINATIESETFNNVIYKSYIIDPFEAGISYTITFDIETLLNSSICFTTNEWNYNSNYIPY